MDPTLMMIGALGGALPDVIRLVQGRYQEELPKHLTSMNFWLGFVLLLGLGAFSPYLGGAQDWKAALAMGYAAPELISRVLSGQSVRLSGSTGRFAVIKCWWSY